MSEKRANEGSLESHLSQKCRSLRIPWALCGLPEKELREELQGAYEELNRLYREQEQAALTDVVTGLFNHRAFIQRLDEAIARGQTEASRFLLVFLDLDHFKAINDTWGHLAGDAVLHEVAERLREALSPGDVAARYGGEEFALLLNLNGATRALGCSEGERLRQIIQSPPCSWPGAGETKTGITVTASIGVTMYGMSGTQRDQLIEQADQAMYRAKLDGRNCVRVAGT